LRQARSEPRELKKSRRWKWKEERTSGGGDGHPFATRNSFDRRNDVSDDDVHINRISRPKE
jgi:hypothetical protein